MTPAEAFLLVTSVANIASVVTMGLFSRHDHRKSRNLINRAKEELDSIRTLRELAETRQEEYELLFQIEFYARDSVDFCDQGSAVLERLDELRTAQAARSARLEALVTTL